jgi:hypothetical protein
MSHRREILKHYVMALIAEGYFDPRQGSAQDMWRALSQAIREDASGVLREVAEFVFVNARDHYIEKLQRKVSNFVDDIARRGFSAVFDDLSRNLKATYKRGVDAETRRGMR